MDLSYILNALGEERDRYFNAVAPPIIQTSNFAYQSVDEMRRAFDSEFDAYLYSRGMNPTVDILRKKLAALEGSEDCLVFNSGVAAIFAAVMSVVQSGDHIVCVDKPYSWVQKLLNDFLPRYGITTTYIDGRYIEHFERAILPNTKLIYLESPNSWDFALQDLSAVAELARAEGITTICDNSYATGLWQQPITLGIDLTVQSATKYIGGHSDTVAGVLCGKHETLRRIFASEYNLSGSGIQPFNAWLLLRGLRTLPARLDRIAASTTQMVDYLEGHPGAERVIFPWHPSFPQYDLAKKQMNNAGGLCSFILRADTVLQIEQFCESLEQILMAVSWGGYESLIIPRCAGIKREDFNPANPEHRMLRLYVGLEDPACLITDLNRAFAAIGYGATTDPL